MIIQLIIVLSDGTLLRGDAEEIKLVPPAITTKTFLFLLKKHILFTYFFRESGGEVEREGEKHGCVRETSVGCFIQGLGPCPRYVP